MNLIIRKLVLASGIGLALGGIGSALAVESKPADTMSEQVVDARREAQIWTSYAMNRHLHAFEIKVKVDGNKAVLDGTVESGVEKDLAEQIALGVEGIKHVDNRLVVDANYVPTKRTASDRSFGEKVEDATITATIKSKLLWNTHTDGLDINVDTNNGKVTLTGTASTSAEKDLAGRIGRNTNGVSGLNNQITVTNKHDTTASTKVKAAGKETSETVSDAWITTKVKSTLLFSSNVEGTAINVDTNNGVVSLSGTIHTSAERDLAIELAQNVRGVKKVDASGLRVS